MDESSALILYTQHKLIAFCPGGIDIMGASSLSRDWCVARRPSISLSGTAFQRAASDRAITALKVLGIISTVARFERGSCTLVAANANSG